jgi:WD40 repeat protein
VPPDYKTFLVVDGLLGVRRSDAFTGKQLDAGKANDNPGGGPLVVSADGKRAVGLHTNILTVCDVATGKVIRELKPSAEFSTFTFSGDGLLSLSADGKRLAQGVTNLRNYKGLVVVWDVDESTILAQFDVPQQGAAVPVLSADGKLLATHASRVPFGPDAQKRVDSISTIQVWDLDAKKELFQGRVTTPGSLITACTFSPDGALLAAGCGAGPIDLWDVKTHKPKATLLGRTGQGLRIAFAPDGKTLAAVATDGAVQRWATGDGKPLATTEPPTAPPGLAPRDLAFADNERVVAWGALGATLVAWECPSGAFLRPLGEHPAGVVGIGFADGGKQVVTAGPDGRVVRWDAATGRPTGTTALRPSRTTTGSQPPLALHLAPDASRIVATVTPAAVFDPATGTELFVLPRTSPAGVVLHTIPSADGARAVTISAPPDAQPGPKGTVAVWDLVARKKLVEWELSLAPNTAFNAGAALSPSGERLVVARYARAANVERTVLVVTGFDLKTGKKLGEVEDHTVFGRVFVAAGSETAAVVSWGAGRLRLFDFEDGRGRDEVEANGREGGAVVFSPDRKLFAFGIKTNRPDGYGVRVYAWPSGQPVHTFTGHRAPVTALAFAPDGKTLASGSHDTTVLLWDLTGIANPK